MRVNAERDGFERLNRFVNGSDQFVVKRHLYSSHIALAIMLISIASIIHMTVMVKSIAVCRLKGRMLRFNTDKK